MSFDYLRLVCQGHCPPQAASCFDSVQLHITLLPLSPFCFERSHNSFHLEMDSCACMEVLWKNLFRSAAPIRPAPPRLTYMLSCFFRLLHASQKIACTVSLLGR